jgi:hypothetical protein
MATVSFYEAARSVAKAVDVRALLADLLQRAQTRDRLQAEFTEQVTRNRQRREGRPVKLSRAAKEWIQEADRDAKKAAEEQAQRVAPLSDQALLNLALSGWDFAVQLSNPGSYHEDDQPFARRIQKHNRESLRLIKDFYRSHKLPLPILSSGCGIAFTTAFRRALPELGKLGGDCMAIEPVLAALDKLAAKANLAPLSQFVNHDAHGLSGDRPSWFDPAAGLAAVRGLQERVNQSARAVKNSKAVAQDLRALEDDLVRAQQHKVKFHFLMLD